MLVNCNYLSHIGKWLGVTDKRHLLYCCLVMILSVQWSFGQVHIWVLSCWGLPLTDDEFPRLCHSVPGQRLGCLMGAMWRLGIQFASDPLLLPLLAVDEVGYIVVRSFPPLSAVVCKRLLAMPVILLGILLHSCGAGSQNIVPYDCGKRSGSEWFLMTSSHHLRLWLLTILKVMTLIISP